MKTHTQPMTTNNDEEWLPVCGYEGIYEVSSLGRVRSVDRHIISADGREYDRKGVLMTPFYNRGYLGVVLKKKTFQVHRLVAEAFVPNDDPEHKIQVHHKNSVRDDNRSVNLQWVSTSEHVILDNRNEKVSEAKKRFFAEEKNRERWRTFNQGEHNGNWKRKYSKEEIEKRVKHFYKPIYQYDLDMNLIKVYHCVRIAAEENGFDRSCLSRAARGEIKNNISYNYRWFYEEQ